MLIWGFIRWWYGLGWKRAWQSILTRIRGVGRVFSVRLLISTLFKPWKQITESATKDSMLAQKFQAFLSNLVSRIVGMMMRLATLLAAAIAIAIAALGGLALALAWPLLPVLVLVLIWKGYR